MVREFLQETHIEIHSGFSFSPCSAAVRALCAHGIGAKLGFVGVLGRFLDVFGTFKMELV